MTGESAAQDGAVILPAVTGIGGGMHAEHTEAAPTPRSGHGRALGRTERRLPDGEQGEGAPGVELVNGQVSHTGQANRLEATHRSHLGQGRSRLGQDPVNPGGPVPVRGHVGDDQERRPS